MTLEIDSEWLDGFATTKLISDYRFLTNEIASLMADEGFLLDYEVEDLKAMKKTRKALKTVLKYYLGDCWKESV